MRVYLLSLLLLLLLCLSACKSPQREAGEMCETDYDCASPLVCCYCELPAKGISGTCSAKDDCTAERCGKTSDGSVDGSADGSTADSLEDSSE